jgi:hypothetical protein
LPVINVHPTIEPLTVAHSDGPSLANEKARFAPVGFETLIGVQQAQNPLGGWKLEHFARNKLP